MMAQRQSTLESLQTIHPETRLGPVHYTVADLGRQVEFYRDVLGFALHRQGGGEAALGAGGEDLLRLTEQRGARPVRGTTGLYHTAFLLPTQRDLAQSLKRIAEARVPLQGMSNHGTHYALYLADAEGNGIELAWDLPREVWPTRVEDMMQRLSPTQLFSALDDAPWQGLPAGTTIGHVHLHVAELAAIRRFYHEILGFPITFELPQRSGLFFAAGGYHHHIGTNTWQGIGAPPPPPGATGLRHFTLVLPNQEELQRITQQLHQAQLPTEQQQDGILTHDPSQNRVLLTSSS